jgi:ferrochelatase
VSKRAVLLLNLGSPDSTDVGDVRRYLREFLSDGRVLDIPAPLRWFILNCFILPFRPKRSAEAYRKIWTDEGSPLIVTSRKQQQLLADAVGLPVELAMNYGNPSIPDTVARLRKLGIEELLLFPLYPHYAMSSYETVVVKAMREIEREMPETKVTLQQPFYKDADYIEALVASARADLDGGFDLLLFSFHGIPERHLRKSDPSHAHCLTTRECCQHAHPAHATCYRHQCFETAHAFVEKAGIPADKFSVSFQSRLGSDPWLKPYTDFELERFAQEGIKKILVMCPAFISDCLETLEEIAMEGAETFEEHGGESFKLIPCLNEHPQWIEVMAARVQVWSGKEALPAEPVSVD